MHKVQDHYFKKAKQENYFARSVYKLEEIDKKYGLLKKGVNVLDIGCSPGSWSQYILKKIGNGRLVGIDLKNDIRVNDSRFTFISGDILSIDGDYLNKRFNNIDIITSDAAPNTTGNKFTDSVKSLRIAKKVFSIAKTSLTAGGTIVVKVFQGEDLKALLEEMKEGFEKVSLFKPKSSRKESREIFIIAQNRR